MSAAVATRNGNGQPPVAAAELMESVVIKGDLSKLTAQERGQYYMAVCKSVGLNPLTKPFEYITLNGKLTLYALRNCTDQLRAIHNISVVDMTEGERGDVCIVTCKVANSEGRTDIAKGAVNLGKLQGEALANAIMKCETKAKRRATLSICGLGLLDETEIEDIPSNVKTLPKKDARGTYEKLQREINEAVSHDALRQWGEESRERIAVLPVDWQDILRAHYHERIVELRQLGDKKEQPSAGTSDDGTVPEDPEKFLKYADALLSSITDPGMLEPTYDFKIAPHIELLLPPDQEEVMGLYRKHEARLAA